VNRGVLYYIMIPLLIVASLLQSTVATRFEIRGVKPDIVLLLIMVGSLIYGSRSSIGWAFVGGLCLDIFSGGPMGTSSLALMAAALVASTGHRTLSRFNVFVPVGVAMASTAVYGLSYVSILLLLNSFGVGVYRVPLWETVQYVIAPSLIYNTTLMIILLPFLNRIPESQGA
jgi:rod shape-determining protein MreD